MKRHNFVDEKARMLNITQTNIAVTGWVTETVGNLIISHDWHGRDGTDQQRSGYHCFNDPHTSPVQKNLMLNASIN